MLSNFREFTSVPWFILAAFSGPYAQLGVSNSLEPSLVFPRQA
jgi:hypothetical protein